MSCFASKNETLEDTSPKPGFAGSTVYFTSDIESSSSILFRLFSYSVKKFKIREKGTEN